MMAPPRKALVKLVPTAQSLHSICFFFTRAIFDWLLGSLSVSLGNLHRRQSHIRYDVIAARFKLRELCSSNREFIRANPTSNTF